MPCLISQPCREGSQRPPITPLFRIYNPEAATEGICNPRYAAFEQLLLRIANPRGVLIRDCKSRKAEKVKALCLQGGVFGNAWGRMLRAPTAMRVLLCKHPPSPPSKGEYLAALEGTEVTSAP
ncbi:hypothetical protein FHS90_002480 [Rufibacter quisquiliarum]|uniref:Uncharacterized protein n=1 Tax=Rufibacter quisquiliarum TaxID=1549639 RepID=A0A839GVG4_9BACT|nr:hypothetical protein [Rufibacter quisquiliarum]